MYKKQTNSMTITYPVIAFITFLLIWQGIDYAFNIREIILPSPIEIAQGIAKNFFILLKNMVITLLESVLGLLFGMIIAILLAIIFTYSRTTKAILYPYAIALKSSPLYVIAPLLILWFGNGIFSKVVMSATVAFFPILVGAVKGFNSIEQSAFDLLKSLGASKLQIFIKLRIPHSLPYIFPSLKVASTLAIVGATIAEFTGSSHGIGHTIVYSSYYLDTSLMFAAIILISVVGTLLFYIINYTEQKIVFWHNYEEVEV